MWYSCYCTLREAYATLTAVKCNFWPLRSLKQILQVKTLLLSWISACREIVMLFAPGVKSHHQGADGYLCGGHVEWIVARQNISALLIDCYRKSPSGRVTTGTDVSVEQ